MSNIDLTAEGVVVRENRLGSITGYCGSFEDLRRRSQDGSLKERERSFSQCTMCASVTAICQVAMIQDAAVVNHGPLGCAGDFGNFNFINRAGRAKRGWPIANSHLINSNLQDRDIVFGGAEKLKEAVREAKTRFNPKVVFVTTSCASGIIGDDVPMICATLEKELSITVAPISCEGFRSQIWATGFDAAYHAILSRVVKPAVSKRSELINIINFWGEDVFTDLFGRLGLVPNYAVPFSTIDQLERLSEAAATVQICPTLGTYLAAGLEEHFGVQEVKAPSPYGIAGMDAWLRELGRITRKKEEVELLIAEEHARIAPELADLRERLSGIRVFLGAGGVHAHSLVAVVRELGMEAVGATVWQHDQHFDHNEPGGDTLRHISTHYGNIPLNVCNKQSFEIVNLLNRLRPDIFIVRHNGMAVWGAKLGIPTLLMGDEHFGLGYQGLLNYGRRIMDAITNPSFVLNLARHTRLPYTRWWLDQQPFTFLGEET